MTTRVLEERFEAILRTDPDGAPEGEELGRSRENRPLRGYRLGRGTRRVSLVGGCHADEPVGPMLLRRLVAHLHHLPHHDPLVRQWDWWIVPHANPDGEFRNAGWQKTPGDHSDHGFDLPSYLSGAVREPPGDDLEFGFPRSRDDAEARPEARALDSWWRSSDTPFVLHASLHGMAFGAGPWLLLESAWWERSAPLRHRFLEKVRAMGYRPHDVERRGEKGFVRLGPGFATRPDSQRMRDHFLARDDPDTAARFRPSSMEAARRLGGDPLTLVTEMPLFLTPGVGWVLGPPDPVQRGWRTRVERWRVELERGRAADEIRADAAEEGLRPMPVRHQMALQWAAIADGLRLVARGVSDSPPDWEAGQDPPEPATSPSSRS